MCFAGKLLAGQQIPLRYYLNNTGCIIPETSGPDAEIDK